MRRLMHDARDKDASTEELGRKARNRDDLGDVEHRLPGEGHSLNMEDRDEEI